MKTLVMRRTAIGPSTVAAPNRARAGAQKPPRGLRSQPPTANDTIARKPSSGARRWRQRNSSAPATMNPADSASITGQGWSREKNRCPIARKKAIELAASSRPRRPPGLGGTWMKTLRPAQNTTVATTISTPGIPNATRTPSDLPYPRDQQVGEEAAEVDDEVERLVDGAQSEPVALAELIADVGRDARLDPARADRDQPQPRPHAPDRVRAQREQEAAAGVDDRQPQDGAVLAQQAIGDDRADHRQRVDRGEEQVEVLLRGGLGGAAEQAVLRVQHGQVRRQEGTDAVEREPLGALVADDVRDAGRPAGALLIGGAARRHPRLLARLATQVTTEVYPGYKDSHGQRVQGTGGALRGVFR